MNIPFQRLIFASITTLALVLSPLGSLPVRAAAADDFVITVKTDNPGSSSTQFTIPTAGSGYNYNVDCDDNGSFEATAQTGDYTCNYGEAGTYTVRIRDNSGAGTGFPLIYFHNGGDRQKLLSIKQWGTGQWISMNSAFYGCSNLTLAASDSPDLSNVTDLSRMFEDTSSFNQPIGGWDVSHVTDMTGMFWGATSFNQPIGGWNVTQVADMSIMFNNVTLSQPNYDALLTGWNGQALQTGVTFSGGNSKYCAGESARSHLISADGWTISDGGKAVHP